jgi:hypothetical protein
MIVSPIRATTPLWNDQDTENGLIETDDLLHAAPQLVGATWNAIAHSRGAQRPLAGGFWAPPSSALVYSEAVA